jgi:hypothetical protein
MDTQRVVDINGLYHKRIFKYWDKFLFFMRKYTKIKRYYSGHSHNYVWEKVYISISDRHSRFKTRLYEVYLTEDNPRFKYVIKPCKKINSLEFENLFRFGFNCKGYSPDRMIAFTQPKNYSSYYLNEGGNLTNLN